MNKASFLQRFAAWLIDQGIVLIFQFLLAAVCSLFLGASDTTSPSGSPLQVPGLTSLLGIILFLLILLIQFLYFGYFWSTRGRSIGMGLVNIKVLKTDDRPLSFLMAGLRGTLGYYLSGLIFGLGYLWFFFDERKETWHDKIFSTNVFKG